MARAKKARSIKGIGKGLGEPVDNVEANTVAKMGDFHITHEEDDVVESSLPEEDEVEEVTVESTRATIAERVKVSEKVEGTTLKQIQGVKDVLLKIVNAQLPIRLAYKFSKMVPVLEEELTIIEEFRIRLIEKYGEEDKDGTFNVSTDNMKIFLKEFNELLNSETTAVFPTVTIEELESTDVKLSPLNIGKLFDSKILVD